MFWITMRISLLYTTMLCCTNHLFLSALSIHLHPHSSNKHVIQWCFYDQLLSHVMKFSSIYILWYKRIKFLPSIFVHSWRYASIFLGLSFCLTTDIFLAWQLVVVLSLIYFLSLYQVYVDVHYYRCLECGYEWME